MRYFSVRNTPYVLFEPDEEELRRVASEAGFQVGFERQSRAMIVTLQAREPRSMFFDATDKKQSPRLALARTFVCATTGVVYNTPFVLENRAGSRVAVRIATEVRWDLARKFPQGPTETSVIALFSQLVQDLAAGMVGFCGTPAETRAAVSAS